MTIDISLSFPLVETILEPWRATLDDDFRGYRNHVYRMLHCCFALRTCDETERKKCAIAACFHDLGMWPGRKADYLPPSIQRAVAYLEANGLQAYAEEIALMIDLHHKLRPVSKELDQKYPLIEIFRRADLADFSLGTIRGDVTKDDMKALQKAFPNAGFHKMLCGAACNWFLHHPITPPPFLKW